LSEIIQNVQTTAMFFLTFKNLTKLPHLLRINCHTTFLEMRQMKTKNFEQSYKKRHVTELNLKISGYRA
jgi:hypothetical protein